MLHEFMSQRCSVMDMPCTEYVCKASHTTTLRKEYGYEAMCVLYDGTDIQRLIVVKMQM